MAFGLFRLVDRQQQLGQFGVRTQGRLNRQAGFQIVLRLAPQLFGVREATQRQQQQVVARPRLQPVFRVAQQRQPARAVDVLGQQALEAVQGVALELFSRKATAVATNVPGPQQPLYMGGSRLRDMMFWVPQTGSIGIGVSILSYNGRVHFGLIADAKLIPDPDAVIRRFGPEFDKLLYLSLMGDWERTLDAPTASGMLS